MAGTQWSWHQRVRWLITLRVEIAAEGTRGRAFLINYHIICSLYHILYIKPKWRCTCLFCQIGKLSIAYNQIA